MAGWGSLSWAASSNCWCRWRGWGGGVRRQSFVGCFNKLLVSLANCDRLVDPVDMQGLTLGRDRARDYFQFFRVNICADPLVSTRPRVYTDRLCTLKIPRPPLDKRAPNGGGWGGEGALTQSCVMIRHIDSHRPAPPIDVRKIDTTKTFIEFFCAE